MGKGRCSGSERLLRPVSHHVAAADHDLDEEDVWSVLAAAPPAAESNGRSRQPEADRRGRWAAGGLSLAFEAHSSSHHRTGAVASSAPVKVPEWAKFPGEQQQYAGYGVSCREKEEEAGEWVAPHEYLQAGRSGETGTASSVLEGVGRKLKGRDLSRVRDAVWSNTGFLG